MSQLVHKTSAMFDHPEIRIMSFCTKCNCPPQNCEQCIDAVMLYIDISRIKRARGLRMRAQAWRGVGQGRQGLSQHQVVNDVSCPNFKDGELLHSLIPRTQSHESQSGRRRFIQKARHILSLPDFFPVRAFSQP